jgi:putative two-component system response regulator
MAKVAAFIGSKFGLDQEQCKILEMITPMHDIGKIAISNEILQKPGKLTDDEYEEVKRHASIGYELFKDSENSLLSQAAEVTLYHHEKWDGSGYPVGLKGDEIPINSQIVGICDIYDALRSVRSYKRSWTVEETVEYFNSNKGTLFQEKLVDILVDNIDEIEKLRH